MRLRSRLAVAYLVPTLALLAAFAWLVHELARRSLEQELGARLIGLARVGAGAVPGEAAEALAAADPATRTYANVRRRLLGIRDAGRASAVLVIDRDLRVLCDDAARVPPGTRLDRLELDRAELGRVFAGGEASSVLFRGPGGRWYKSGYAPVHADDGRVVAAVAVDGSAAFFDQLGVLRSGLLGVGAAVAALLVAISAAVARRITAPVADLEEAARRIGQGRLDAPIAVASRDEIGLFASTMDQMRRDLSARERELVMMLAGIAHEVRNPLGAMKLWCGLLRESLASDVERLAQVERVERELAQLDRVVSEFLDFARRAPPDLADVDVALLLREVGDVCAPEAHAAGVTLRVAPADGLRVRADAGALRRALVNLARNAVQATPSGGSVEIGADADAARARLRLRVTDTGAGIAPEHLDEVFRPFFTTREKGTGLGLAFVRRAAEDHGGRVTVESRAGQGSTFTIEIPL